MNKIKIDPLANCLKAILEFTEIYCQHLRKEKNRLIIASNLLKLKVKSDSQQLLKNIGELFRTKTVKDSFPILLYEQGKYN